MYMCVCVYIYKYIYLIEAGIDCLGSHTWKVILVTHMECKIWELNLVSQQELSTA